MSEANNPQGTGPLTVSDAASAFESLMDAPPEAPEESGQAEAVEVAASDEDAPEVELEADDAEQESDEEPEESPRYRVSVDGEEVEITLDEALKGYQRQAAFTKKTQELAEQRKAVEAEKAEIESARAERQRYLQGLSAIEQALQQQMPQENLEALKETDPIGYAVAVAERTEREKQLAAVRAERAQVEAKAKAEQQQQLQAHLQREASILAEVIPEFAKPETAAKAREEIRSYAKKVGFTDEELAKVYDHRAVVALWKAAQFDRLMSKKPEVAKKVAEAPKMLKAGTNAEKGRDPARDQMNKLKRTGKVGDAASLFERFL